MVSAAQPNNGYVINIGDLILVRFPFTDLSATKLRPAIVLHFSNTYGDLTLCFLSSRQLDRLQPDEFLISETDPDFAMTGLKTTSKVRVTKIATLDRHLAVARLGSLSARHRTQLNQMLVNVLQLTIQD